MNRIIYTNTDGSLGVLIPSKETSIESLTKDVPEGLSYEVIDESDVPSDRAYRNAWQHDKTSSPQKAAVNTSIARDMSVGNVRAEVKAQFTELNKEGTIAIADGMTLDQARELMRDRGNKLKGATDKLKALDLSKDALISVEAAAELLLPLEVI